MSKIKIIFLAVPILLIIFYWKNTLLNMSDHLYDWNDTLYFIWLIQNHIHNLTSLNFSHLYDATAMYPFKYALSFGEQFFFPSVVSLLISQFNKNPIFQLNFLLVVNHILIFVSFYMLVSLFVKNYWSKVIAAFYFSFSPYFFAQLVHFQMVFFWPLLFSLYFLFKDREIKDINKKNLLFSGLFLGIQFMSSVYLGTMGALAVMLFFAVRLFFERKFISLSKQAIILLVVFLLTAGISIYGYMLAKSEYGGKRELGEFITYSAHLSDYIFPVRNHTSVLYQNPLIVRWNGFDNHNLGEKAAFIGFLPLIIVFFYLVKYDRDKKSLTFSVKLNKLTLFLVLLGLLSFIASLGPRLSVNGSYLHIPLPYDLAIKSVSLIEFLRALARWFSLVTLAIALLLALGLDNFFDNLTKRLSQQKVFIVGLLIFGLFILEFYPKPLEVSKKEWWSPTYSFMRDNLCIKNSPAVLEYPFVYRNWDGGLIKDLQYKMVILLASTQHSCKILSGFSGYEPPEYIKIKGQLDSNGIDQDDLKLLRKLDFKFIKLNKFAITEEEKVTLLKDLSGFGLEDIYHDENVNIYGL